MSTTVDYHINRGEPWERLVIIKDKRTHRKRVPTVVAASVSIGLQKYVIPTTITSEGGVRLSLTPAQTEWFVDGEYLWDMVATVSRSALLTSTPLAELVTAKGTLIVETYANITPMGSDGNGVPLTEVV